MAAINFDQPSNRNVASIDPALTVVNTKGTGVTATGLDWGLEGHGDPGVGGGGVFGISEKGTGVFGESGSGTGVLGSSSTKYGGDFSGGLAPLILRHPENAQGPPTSGNHQMGELFVDNQGVLYFCVANGTPGTWKKVQLV